jgi:hypothetical protein
MQRARSPAANYFYNARVERKAAARSTNAKLPAGTVCFSHVKSSAALQNL